MKKIYHLLVLTIILSITSACTSNPASLDREVLKKEQIDTVYLQAPKKLTHERSDRAIQTSNAMIGGAIGALIASGIDAAIEANRKKAMQPILASLGDYDTEAQLLSKLKTLSGTSFKQPLTIKAVEDARTPIVKVLRISARPRLNANHQSVVTEASLLLKLKEDMDTEYHRKFQESVAIDFGGQQGINATQYLIDNPNKLKAAVDQTLDAIVKKIADDINTAPPEKK